MTRGRKWLRRLGIVSASILALGLVCWSLAELWSRPLLARELEAAKKLGPLAWEELQPPMPPAGENGIWEIQHAAALLRERKPTTQANPTRLNWSVRPPPGPPSAWPQKDVEALRGYLQSLDEAITLIRKAADRPYIRAPLDRRVQPLFELSLPHLAELKPCARTLRMNAYLALYEGRGDEAAQDLVRVGRLGASFDDESVMVSALVGLSIRGMTCSGVDTLMAQGTSLTPSRIEELERALVIPRDLSRRMLLADRAFGVDLYQHVRDGTFSRYLEAEGLTAEGVPPWILTLLPASWLRWDETHYLRVMDTLLASSSNPPSPYELWKKTPRLCTISRCVLPSLDRPLFAERQVRAMADATRWGLALRLAQARADRLPQALGDLLADRPLDPFTGNPFIYKPDPDGKGFLLYSVGPDGKDDGGSIVAAANGEKPSDLGIHWKVP